MVSFRLSVWPLLSGLSGLCLSHGHCPATTLLQTPSKSLSISVSLSLLLCLRLRCGSPAPCRLLLRSGTVRPLRPLSGRHFSDLSSIFVGVAVLAIDSSSSGPFRSSSGPFQPVFRLLSGYSHLWSFRSCFSQAFHCSASVRKTPSSASVSSAFFRGHHCCCCRLSSRRRRCNPYPAVLDAVRPLRPLLGRRSGRFTAVVWLFRPCSVVTVFLALPMSDFGHPSGVSFHFGRLLGCIRPVHSVLFPFLLSRPFHRVYVLSSAPSVAFYITSSCLTSPFLAMSYVRLACLVVPLLSSPSVVRLCLVCI